MFRDKLQICYTINVIIIIIRSGRARVMLPNSDINFEKSKLYCQKCACLHIAQRAVKKYFFLQE